MELIESKKITTELPSFVARELQPNELRYVTLSRGEKVSQIAEKRMIDFSGPRSEGLLIDIVRSVLFSAGSKMDAMDIKMICIDFYKKLHEMNKHTSIDDIREALTLGVCHKLTTPENPDGKYYGISIATFFDWINIYLFQQERMSAMQKLSYLQPKKEAVLSQEQLDKIFYKEINVAYSRYLKTGITEDPGNTFFDGLYSRKQILISDKDKEKLIDECVNEIGTQMINRLNTPSVSRDDYNEKKKIPEQLENLNPKHPLVTSMAKKKLLKRFYDQQTTV